MDSNFWAHSQIIAHIFWVSFLDSHLATHHLNSKCMIMRSSWVRLAYLEKRKTKYNCLWERWIMIFFENIQELKGGTQTSIRRLKKKKHCYRHLCNFCKWNIIFNTRTNLQIENVMDNFHCPLLYTLIFKQTTYKPPQCPNLNYYTFDNTKY